MFTNMVRTDGYGIDFILTVPERQSNKLSNLDLNDFTPEEINERFHLWGVNPGQINIFTASDGHNTNPHQLRKYSTAEYYTRTGFKKTNLHILNYIGRQRADAEMVNIFVNGGKKYLRQEFKQTGRDKKRGNPKRKKRRPVKKEKGKGKEKLKKRKLKPFEPDNRIPLVALGEAIFPTSMKGTIPGLARRLVTVLKKAEDEDLLVTVPVTEYITSKVSEHNLNKKIDLFQLLWKQYR
ncbi:hypothetical protein BDF21DRAFT_427729 [Thamnidium elegans]|nr:hypothetical protein BDF21DRAFT_427729 [Thamnidium elegans]